MAAGRNTPLVHSHASRSRHNSRASSAHESAFTEVIEMQRATKARQTFIMIVVADFLCTLIMWLLVVVLSGKELIEDFRKQVNFSDPNFFKKSLFDLVLAVTVRALLLVAIYGACKCNRRWPTIIIAVPSICLIIVKVLYFFLGKDQEQQVVIPSIMLILGQTAFVIMEVFRVPTSAASFDWQNRSLRDDEEALIGSSDSQRSARARLEALRAELTEDDYRTAMELSDSGDDEAAPSSNRIERKVQKLLRQKALQKIPAYRPYSNVEYLETARNARAVGERWLTEVNKWQRASAMPLVRYHDDKEHGRVYYLNLTIDTSAANVFHVMYTNFTSSRRWNINVLENRIVCRIDTFTDVVHNTTAPQLRGAISSRDFLDVRQFDVDDSNGIYTIVQESVLSNVLPPAADTKRVVRGHNGPNFWRIKPIDGGRRTSFEWFNNTNLRVAIPKRMMHSGTVNFLIEYSRALQGECDRVQRENIAHTDNT